MRAVLSVTACKAWEREKKYAPLKGSQGCGSGEKLSTEHLLTLGSKISVGKTGGEETGENFLQRKEETKSHGDPAPPLLTHSLALPDGSSWKGGGYGHHKAKDGLLGCRGI